MTPLPPRVRMPGRWLRGPIHHLRRDPLRWIPAWFREYGDVFMIASAMLRVLMGDGLVTSAGEFWRGQRKLVQPAFHRRRLDAIFGMMVERALECVDRSEERR